VIIAHHLIWTAYGWWLPNDPRGSTSHVIHSDVIAELGELHYGRKKVQPASADIRAFYERARGALKHALLTFDPPAIDEIALAFADVVGRERYTCWACAIMPDHVHVLIRKHRDRAEQMIAALQEASRRRLRSAGVRTPDHPVWGGPGWKVFQDHPDDVRRTIRYIERNPAKLRLPVQRWGFVKRYDGWPLHPGHSPRSPYARRRRGEPF
jgi:REP element-mobilizing transposase RayT